VDRRSDTWFKRTTAWAFYRVLGLLTNVSFPQHAGDFRLVDEKVLKLMAGSQELAPYWRGLAVWVGFPRVLVPYERHSREAGETKFTIPKMMAFAADAIFSFSRKPLRISGYLGAAVSAVSFLVISVHLAWLVMGKHDFVPGWLSLLCLVGLIGGMQLICLGILGAYVGRIYELALKRPSVIVQDSLQVNGQNLPIENSGRPPMSPLDKEVQDVRLSQAELVLLRPVGRPGPHGVVGPVGLPLRKPR
jgi:dolichol-phosphate mannosyltransferase